MSRTATRTLTGPTGPATPATPTISVVNDGTGTSVTATIASDSSVLNQLFYKAQADALWTAGEVKTGPGDLQQLGLAPLTLYQIQVVSAHSVTGRFSLPSNLCEVMVLAGAATLIKEAIGARIVSLLQALIPAHLSVVERPHSVGWPESPKHRGCYVFQGNAAPPEDAQMESEGRHLMVTTIQPYELHLIAMQSDTDATPVDAVLNAMEAAVLPAILSDGQDHIGEGLAGVDLGSVWFDPVPLYARNPMSQSICSVVKRVLVEFRHPQNSLFLSP